MADTRRDEGRDAGGALLAGVELGGTKCICLLATAHDRIVAQLSIPTGVDAAATLGRLHAHSVRLDQRAQLGAVVVAPQHHCSHAERADAAVGGCQRRSAARLARAAAADDRD